MKNLRGFSVPNENEIPLCEVEGRVHSAKYDYADINAFTNAVSRHPKIHITRDMLHSLISGDETRQLFLPVHQSSFKQVAKIWYEQGFIEAFRFVTNNQRTNSKLAVIGATWALEVINVFSRICNIVQPHNIQDKNKLLNNFSQTRNWFTSPIRCIAWHPHCTKLALASSDDSIRIFSTDTALVPILKSKLQKSISNVAWRPLSASELAVGCETCILIWTVDPNSVVTRPSTANSYILRRIDHHPIISLVWSPQGEYLVSASPADSALLVWDVALNRTSTLKRAGTLGNTFLCWSQNGINLLAASSSLVFRVWECHHWKADRWTTTVGRIQTACWSPCGAVLLFATSEEPILYSLCFKLDSSIFTNDTIASPQIATPLLDLSRIELPNGELLGGLVQTMEWDCKGRHVAILFKDTNYVAVFMTTFAPTLNITPSCLISGIADEVPTTLAFQKNFLEGSCLTIAWSSGRLQYFPLIYSDSREKTPSFTSNNPESFNASYNNPYSSF